MEAQAKTVKAILHSGDQYLVPFFQRHYAWQKKHWTRLSEDILDLVADESGSQHFLGPLVCTPFNPTPGNVTAFQLIDGQQRLTTLTLALAGLRDACLDPNLKEEITEDFLIHKRRERLQRYKVVPRLEDRTSYIQVVEGQTDDLQSGGIADAYAFFKKVWANQLNLHGQDRGKAIKACLTERLSLVTITISGENPYEIFESLNSTGEPLEEADLIRNFIFMQVPLDRQDRFHEETWAPFEAELLKVTSNSSTPFYRTYLMRNGSYVRKGSTFVAFKEYQRESKFPPEEVIGKLKQSLTCYGWLLNSDSAPSPKLRIALRGIDLLDITTAHPVLLHLLERNRAGSLSEADLLACMVDLSSFVLRRTICGDSTRAYGRWFAEAAQDAGSNSVVGDLQTYWLERGWPDDATFSKRLQDFAIYKRERRKAQFVLETMERDLSPKEGVMLPSLQIEHILPQSIGEDPKGEWQTALGSNWKTVHERCLHALPNLTLTGYNVEMSNGPFPEKKKIYEVSNLRLTRKLADFTVWNESSMRQRGEQLATAAIRIWPRPTVGDYTPVSSLGLDDLEPGLTGANETERARYIVATFNWSEIGKSLPHEVIAEPVVAQTMVRVVGRLIEVLGDNAAQALLKFRVSRGPLLSLNPGQDFRNPRSGELYAHKPIPGTPYFVLVNSGTVEKLGQLRDAMDLLRLPARAVKIDLATELP